MRRTTEQWEALLDGLEGVTLAAGHETVPAFDDDPDQSPVDLPCVWITGMEGRWSNIGAPGDLVPVLAASIDSVAEVVRLRRELEDLRDYLADPWQAESIYEEGQRTGYGYVASDLTLILEGESNE